MPVLQHPLDITSELIIRLVRFVGTENGGNAGEPLLYGFHIFLNERAEHVHAVADVDMGNPVVKKGLRFRQYLLKANDSGASVTRYHAD